MTTRLLVSVRNPSEARDALAAGADLIDLKEPRRGSLAPVSPRTVQSVVDVVARRVPLSAAQGELLADVPPDPGALAASLWHLSCGVSLAKFGLAGCAQCDDWPARLAQALGALPPTTRGVGVIYADCETAVAPQPLEVIEQAQALGCRAVLVDTWQKGERGLLDWWSLPQCEGYVDRIRRTGMLAVLGGSLTSATIRQLLPLEPDYVAVRGAVCRRSRGGRLDPELVRELAAVVHASEARDGAGDD